MTLSTEAEINHFQNAAATLADAMRTLAAENSAVTSENARLKTENADLRIENDTLRTELRRLRNDPPRPPSPPPPAPLRAPIPVRVTYCGGSLGDVPAKILGESVLSAPSGLSLQGDPTSVVVCFARIASTGRSDPKAIYDALYPREHSLGFRSILVLCHVCPRFFPLPASKTVEPDYLRQGLKAAGATLKTMPEILNFAVVMISKDHGELLEGNAANIRGPEELAFAIARCDAERADFELQSPAP